MKPGFKIIQYAVPDEKWPCLVVHYFPRSNVYQVKTFAYTETNFKILRGIGSVVAVFKPKKLQ